jgi:16S rRNA (guanine527-N7)-methyltransferase
LDSSKSVGVQGRAPDEEGAALDASSALVADELEDSSIPAQILGSAYETLKMFHVKLFSQGQLRGLIGPRELGQLWERHILNSAAIAPFITDYLQAHDGKEIHDIQIADVGSGAGFPGIVLACLLPSARLTLIEPMERRVTWLHEVVQELDLSNVIISRGRAEDFQTRHVSRETSSTLFDIVTCRAVAPMTKLAGMTLPLLRHGGRLIALKGQSAQAEIDKARKEIKRYGGFNPRVAEAVVGPGLENTHVVLIDKK